MLFSGYLYILSEKIVNSINMKQDFEKQEFLKKITKPFTNLIIIVSMSPEMFNELRFYVIKLFTNLTIIVCHKNVYQAFMLSSKPFTNLLIIVIPECLPSASFHCMSPNH